ncbi:uncharacterized protein LOC113332101 [Papaver somniferum]|uniref:uncharacterized protein LOC113332101 n=1 Tax=Papaver somniferum TaxID=3469 RepID=UPI000E70071B|nr:uncharacterized protein LOC113332101 [Papaver somniferum]
MKNVLQILSKEFRKFSVFIFSVHTNASTRLILVRIDTFQHSTLLTSKIFWRFLIQEGVMMTVAHSSWSYLHKSCRVGNSKIQVIYLLMLVEFLRWEYKWYSTGLGNASNASLTISVLMWIMETHLMPKVIQILCVRILVEYWRWKFKLVPPDLWSVGNVSWIANSFISVACFAKNWNYISNLFCKAEVHGQIATTLMQISLILTSLRNFHSKGFGVVYSIVLQNFENFAGVNDKGWIYIVVRSEVQDMNFVPVLVHEQPPDQLLQWIAGLDFKVWKGITWIFLGPAKFLKFPSSFVFVGENLF